MIKINELNKHFNEEVEISGFVDKIRDLQYVQFVILRDLTGKVQITIEKNEVNNELNDLVSTITLESCITVNAKVIENAHVKMGGMELIPTNITIESLSEAVLPLDYKSEDGALRETRLDYRFLDLRREKNAYLFKISTFLEQKMREYFINKDFISINSPKIVKEGAESGSELFELDYFGQKAYLAQSPQLYKQMAMSSGFEKVFEMGFVYRAENSHTSYHSSEIYMIDAEMSYIKSHVEVMDTLEECLRYSLTALNEKYETELQSYFKSTIDVSKPFARMTFKEAKEILKDKMNYVGSNEEDFERREEELLCKYVKDKFKTDFVFVDEYPYSARPFYTMKSENGTTKSFDLLYKGVEVTSGAQREHRVDVLINQISEKGINPDSMSFYTDFFKYGVPPHGGFGFGYARLLMKLLNYDNIREVTYIYRGTTRLNP